MPSSDITQTRPSARPGVYEFFAGGGMARAGLEPAWETLFANDFDAKKAKAYAANYGAERLVCGDVHALTTADLPGRAALAWASSPCQDLSLAGKRGGLAGARSSAFFGFWTLMQGLIAEGRAPDVIVVENVTGLFTSHGGADFTALCKVLSDGEYRFGAVELDAEAYLPQSRPRMFMIACRDAAAPELTSREPIPFLHTSKVTAAHGRLPDELKAGWIWWRMAPAPARNLFLSDILEPDDQVRWMSEEDTARLISLLAPLQRLRLDQILLSGERRVGAVFRRTRPSADGPVQRAEARFDGLAGCLRTPGGGSSRQFVLIAEGGEVRARQLSPREAARLMGLSDDYRLPARSTNALHLLGDGVAVPVVRRLSQELLLPLIGRADRAEGPHLPSTVRTKAAP